ncbi:hypothetical protein P879_03400 [Paragonimus westermani]|uniref:Uncharacterized protein n=1 Tax=Paragonimus westermani TaxID=34504 RepID=A0A8T0DT84_9TREM|nr:hypothetical protein P879_03400 [Paragonimus westermani]
MACNPSDVDEECYVYPAITKRYSQVTLPNQTDINTDNQDQPEPLPQVPTRPLRSTLKARSQFGPEAVSNKADPSDSDQRVNTSRPTQNNNTSHTLLQVKKTRDNVNSGSHRHSAFDNTTEPIAETSLLSAESARMSKRTSIQQLRKYSVVDPNALRYFEGKCMR